jgi:phosphate transport system substrate-binding protein
MLRYTGVVALLLTGLILSCTARPSQPVKHGKHQVTLAGSTSVMPFTEKLAEHFMVDHPRFVVDVQGGGSTAGIQAVMNNTVEIGMSSRSLKEEERRLNKITICYDGIAIVVHPSNPVSALSMEQVRTIFSGQVRNWSEFGWVKRGIDAVTREEGSGTRGAFEDLVMQKTEISDAIMVQDSNGSVKEVVATDPYAIGYISLGLVDGRVKALTIDGVTASINTIKTGGYRIVRPFLYVTNGEPSEDAKFFVEFVLSKDGQGILKREGLVGFHD